MKGIVQQSRLCVSTQTQKITNNFISEKDDQDEQKLVPLTVRVFATDLGMVTSRFFDTCLCSSGTAAAYFDKLEEVAAL